MAETVLSESIFPKTSDSYFRHQNASGQSVVTINGDYSYSYTCLSESDYAHPAIIDRRLFAQAAAVTRMRRVRAGNSSYPYDTMLRCPHCGEILVHGALYPLYFGGRQLRNGGWGCYGPKGCRQFLMIQNVLDAAMLDAHEKKYGSRPEKVDYWWLDELVESINFHEDMVNVRWKDGDELTLEMNPPHPHYVPANAAARYNAYLERIRSGEARTKCKFIMGL